MSNEVTIQNQPAQTVATWRTATSYEQVFSFIPEGFGRVFGELGAQNVAPAGVPFTLYYQAPDADNDGDIAMAVPIAASLTPADGSDIVVVELPATQTAEVIHKGSFASLGESYGAVVGWILENGHEISGPSREIYLNSPEDTAEEDLLTQIIFPIN